MPPQTEVIGLVFQGVLWILKVNAKNWAKGLLTSRIVREKVRCLREGHCGCDASLRNWLHPSNFTDGAGRYIVGGINKDGREHG
jgi:hypothetical protein